MACSVWQLNSGGNIYRASNLTAMYGCVAFTDAMDVDEDEEVLVGLSGFDD